MALHTVSLLTSFSASAHLSAIKKEVMFKKP